MVRRRTMGSQLSTSRPSTITCPLSARTSRLIVLSAVVLPDPLVPRRTRISPSRTESEIRSRAAPPPGNRLVTSSNAAAGEVIGEDARLRPPYEGQVLLDETVHSGLET